MSDKGLRTFNAPLYVAWELTHRCNARCVHCYSASSPDVSTDGELSTDEALRVVDELADAGLMVLAFSGGEPLLRRDWRRLAKRAVARRLTVNIGSNGSSITPRIAEELAGLGVRSVTISIDSHRADTHDRFRNLAGLFERATRAVRLLVDHGVRVVVGYTPTRLTVEDGPGIAALAIELGADALNISEYVPAGRGATDLALRASELRRVLEYWIRMREELKSRIDIMWHDCRVGILSHEAEDRSYPGCGAGRLVARICPDGTVTPCVFLPTAIGSLRERSFQELWDRSMLLRAFRRRAGVISGNCGDCEHLASCGGCRAVAYAYSGGNPFAGDAHCWVKQHSENPATSAPLALLRDGEGFPH